MVIAFESLNTEQSGLFRNLISSSAISAYASLLSLQLVL